MNSPVPGRKRFPSEPPQPIHKETCQPGNTSPLVLQRFYHQQQQIQQQLHQQLQHQQQQLHQQIQQQQLQHQQQLLNQTQNQNHNHTLHHHHYHNHHSLSSYPQSLSPGLQMPTEPVENFKGEESSNSGKKRFTSILKFSLGGSNNSTSSSPSSPGRMPPPRPTRLASPGPPPPSPDPPPRLSRMGLSDETPSSSPLAGRRSFLDVSPVRRSVLDGSPSLPRR